MSFQCWMALFFAQLQDTSLWEWIAVLMAVAEVLLAWRNSVWLYPAGIISTGIYIYLMAHVSLYAESALNVYYLIMSLYGWMHWLSRRGTSLLPISSSTPHDWLYSMLLLVVSWGILYAVLKHYTNSNVPMWDAWVSATAWVGMWLLARRKVENWLWLNVSNLFAIPLQIYKQLPLTACLTTFLFIVAIFGYYEWRKLLRQQQLSLKNEPN